MSMPGPPYRQERRALLLIGVLLLAIVAMATPAPARAKSKLDSRAEQRVRTAIDPARSAFDQVTCRRVHRQRGERRRWACPWVTRSELRDQVRTCRGRHVVALKRRNWQLRRRGRHCADSHRPVHVSSGSAITTPAAPPPASSPPPAKSLLFGFSDNSVLAKLASASQDATLNAGAGANVVRVTFEWRWAEPARDDYRWKAWDDIYQASLARGIRPLFVLAFAPSWALDPSSPCNQWASDCRLPPGRSYDGELEQIAGLLAQRYPQSAGIEVWNEPNQTHFWTSGPDPVRYTEMLKAAYRGVKRVAPSMPVVGGSLSDNPATRDGIPPKPFLHELYAHGAKGNMDGIAVHPYPHANGLVDKTLADVRDVRHEYGDDARPLWVTETGWTTSGWNSPTWPDEWIATEDQQASRLVDLYRKLSAMSDVQAVIFHTMIEPTGDSDTSPYPGYGVVRQSFQRKPAYCAIARARGIACTD